MRIAYWQDHHHCCRRRRALAEGLAEAIGTVEVAACRKARFRRSLDGY